MEFKFRIVLDNGDVIESHDEDGEQVKDHCHALAPNSDQHWREYWIETEAGHKIGVNFETGIFDINGRLIHPAIDQGEPLTNQPEEQEFPVTDAWSVLNGMNYFPVVGRRVFKGDWGIAKIPFCGWKKKVGDKTIQKVVYVYPTGAVVMT